MWSHLSYDAAFWISIATMALVLIGGAVVLLRGRSSHAMGEKAVTNRMGMRTTSGLAGPRLRLMNLRSQPGQIALELVNTGGPAQQPTLTCAAAEDVRRQPACAWHAGGRIRLTFGFVSPPGPFQFTVRYQDQLGQGHERAFEVRPSERCLEPIE